MVTSGVEDLGGISSGGGGGGGGTVTSVALAAPASILSVSGSPVLTNGTLTLSLPTQSANRVWAGPTSGIAATPTFRALVSADIPALSYVTSVALSMPSIFTVTGSPVTSSGTLSASLNSQSQNLFLASPNGSSGTPTFRAIAAADVPALSYVTSVALTTPAEFTVSGSPITSSGTLAISKASQSANTVYAGPTSGGAVAPAFRSLVAADIPALPYSPSALTNTHIFVGNGSNVATDVALSGDATLANTGALTVTSVGGSSAANVNSATVLALAATSANTASAIVKRDSSGNFITTSEEITGFIMFDDASAPSTPASGKSKVYVSTTNTISRLRFLDSTGMDSVVQRDNYNVVVNNTGGTLTKGSAVYITGVSGGLGTIALAKADSATTSPAYGILAEDIANNASGRVQFTGVVSGIDTSGFSSGAILYLSPSSAGQLTSTKPTAPNIAQTIAVVLTSSVSGSVTLTVRDNQNVSSGTNLASFKIGTGAGASAVSLAFANANTATVSCTPTATRAIILPDVSGTIALSTSVASANMASIAVGQSPYTALTTDSIIFVTTAGGAVSINLPNPNLNRTIRIKDVGGTLTTNNLTLVRFGSEQIEGVASSKTLSTNYGAWVLQSDGTNYWMM